MALSLPTIFQAALYSNQGVPLESFPNNRFSGLFVAVNFRNHQGKSLESLFNYNNAPCLERNGILYILKKIENIFAT